MRPLRLEFQAFGSYPGKHVIDFEALARRGLFVVAGPTGTGKTTVFDAMVYGLFGVLPGERSADGDPRSHHAAAHVATYVTLDFEVDGTRYQVHRSPKQDRPKQRGSGTTVQSPMAVVGTGGAGGEVLATQATNTTRMCEQLVGLDAKQFQRVVLLPQGKFTDFLIATDEDREKLLRQLFGGELFELAVAWMKRRVAELDAQVSDVDAMVQHHRANAVSALVGARDAWVEGASIDDGSSVVADLGDHELQLAIDELQPVMREHQRQLDGARARAIEATERQVAAEGDAQRFDRRRDAQLQLDDLQLQSESVNADEARAEASRHARPVVAAAAAVDAAAAKALAAREASERLREVVASGFASLGHDMPTFGAATVAAALAKVSQQLEADDQLLRATQSAAARAAATGLELAEARADQAAQLAAVTEAKAAITGLKARAGVLEIAAATVGELRLGEHAATARLAARSELDAELRLLQPAEAAEAVARSGYEQLMVRFVATQAPLLALGLRPGEACPVCGSAEHPAPAVHADGEPVDHHVVDAAREHWSQQSRTVTSYRTAIDMLRVRLGDGADDPLDQFAAALVAASSAVGAAQAAADELVEVRARWDLAEAELEQAVQASQAGARHLAVLEARATQEQAEADRLAVASVGVDSDRLRANVATTAVLAAAVAGITATFDAVTATSAALIAAEARVAEVLAISGCADVPAARATALDQDIEAQCCERAAAWRSERADVSTRLAQLEEQGVPAERPDVEAIAAAAAAANAQAHTAAEVFTTAANALATANSELAAAAHVAAGSADLRCERDAARMVFKTCNGEAGMRVKLERWVLAGELDRVTAAANVHLARMTNHRYRLSRRDAKGGLALEVFDAHTGRSRSTVSLSGGEQFQASLSLALGLADVVSRGGSASGKQFEALFVDEGFGSLDPNALDDAIRALTMLQATGRMVGAITHVEAMKQQLHVGIEVRQLADGKGSTLTVFP